MTTMTAIGIPAGSRAPIASFTTVNRTGRATAIKSTRGHCDLGMVNLEDSAIDSPGMPLGVAIL